MNIRPLIVALLIIGALICIWIISSESLTARESTLVGVVLSILSVLGSWLATHIYSESQHKKAIQEVQEFHRKNLQTYAKKAAEKVNNLSKELGRLATYLADELDRTESDDPNQTLLSREERIASTIHVINTLKSVNDTALSDWEGVIDDLLEQQREEKEEKEELFLSLVEGLDPLIRERLTESPSSPETDTIRHEVAEVRKDLRAMAVSMGIARVGVRGPKRKRKQDVAAECPACKTTLKYQQRAKEHGFKAVRCNTCDTQFVSRYSGEDGFLLHERRVVSESAKCPTCGNDLDIKLDTLPYSAVDATCEGCSHTLRISRGPSGALKIKSKARSKSAAQASEPPVSDEILETVLGALPRQPWPTGVHKKLAPKLNLSPNTVHRAIRALIRKGKVNPQIDGVVYVPQGPVSSEAMPRPSPPAEDGPATGSDSGDT